MAKKQDVFGAEIGEKFYIGKQSFTIKSRIQPKLKGVAKDGTERYVNCDKLERDKKGKLRMIEKKEEKK